LSNEEEIMTLAEILNEDVIEVALKAKNKEEVLVEMVDLLKKGGKIKDKEEILRVVKSREELMSTAIGNGIAIPHGRSNCIDKVVAAFGKSEEGIEDFSSSDKKPVYLIFLLVVPEDNSGVNVKVLARISRLLKHNYFRELLIKTKTSQEVLSLIKKEEAKHL